MWTLKRFNPALLTGYIRAWSHKPRNVAILVQTAKGTIARLWSFYDIDTPITTKGNKFRASNRDALKINKLAHILNNSFIGNKDL